MWALAFIVVGLAWAAVYCYTHKQPDAGGWLIFAVIVALLFGLL